MHPLVKVARERVSDGPQQTHSEGCHRWHRECLIQRLADEVERQQAKIDALMLEHCPGEMTDAQRLDWASAQRVAGDVHDGPMVGCTIVYKQCKRGHSRLTAANWVDHGCQTCEIERLRAELQAYKDAATARDRNEDALREDAERYRWLRDANGQEESSRWMRWRIEHWSPNKTWYDLRGAELDAAIDAERKP